MPSADPSTRDAGGPSDAPDEQFHADYDPGKESPTVAVSHAIAEFHGVDQADLAPLYDTVDPDALQALLRSDESVTVSFEHAGVAVTVTGDGHVWLRPA